MRVELTLRKKSYFLGENILVDFCVVNHGTTGVEIEEGGDYRGSPRALRFKVAMTDEHGTELPDPDPNPMNFGGMGSSPKIKPGAKWCQSLQLQRYRRIDAPGTYTITATHDLGWKDRTAPTGTARIQLAMPTDTQAEQVVADMLALPVDPNNSSGEVAPDYQDFSALRYDVYVPYLERLARTNPDVAFAGLAEIPTVRATKLLVAMLDDSQAGVRRNAARALALRLPDPQLTGALGKRNPFEDTVEDRRRYLGKAWDPALAGDVRTAARRLLASHDPDDKIDGAFMLEAVGEVSDAPDLVAALDAAIADTATTPAETNVYPVPRGPCQELLRAAEILVGRGVTAAPSPKTPGELAVWLVAFAAGQPLTKTDAVIAGALTHKIPYVRQIALEHIPTAPVALVKKNLAHADPDVRLAAAQLAARAKLTALAPDVMAAMRKAKGFPLRLLGNAAAALGAGAERADALVDMLLVKDSFSDVLAMLIDTLEQRGHSGGGELTDADRAAVQAAWKKFVAAHRADIAANKKIPLDDPAVTRDLLPPHWSIHKSDRETWP